MQRILTFPLFRGTKDACRHKRTSACICDKYTRISHPRPNPS